MKILLERECNLMGINKELHLGKEGAHRKRRILHAGGDATGKNILDASNSEK